MHKFFFRFWILWHSKPNWFGLPELLNLDPVKFPVMELAISSFWSLVLFACSCSLALDNGGLVQLAVANLFTVILFSFFVCNGFIAYKQLIGHDPWKDPTDPEAGNQPEEKSEKS